ncbi:MAG: hypothetical protein ABL997_12775, partial [Planctomycetota bacterium]
LFLSTVFSATMLVPHAVRAQEPVPAPANYVAHEWGTFTSMVGQDGLVLDGLHHEEESLPAFVHDLWNVEEFAVAEGQKLPASRVTQKMETPVIYFYTDEPMRVVASVWFQQGLMTQFFPLPSIVCPDLTVGRSARVDMSKVPFSTLEWDVDLIPKGAVMPPEIPAVANDDPWAFARMTQASYVRTRVAKDSPAKTEAEHYLFYRGLGRWQPKVALKAANDGAATFENQMPQAIPFALALELDERGGRYACCDGVSPREQVAFALSAAAIEPDRERFARTVGAIVMQALVEQGLYLDEARAMVATWTRSWFMKDGARVVYLLPQEQLREVLHLSLVPQPKELVRVLVGRLEFITRATQRRVEQALRDQASSDAVAAARGKAVLTGLERFLEPHLRNVERNGADAVVQRAATLLLEQPQR